MSQREEIKRALQGDERLRRDQQLLHETMSGTKSGSSWSSREVSTRWRNWSDFKAQRLNIRDFRWKKNWSKFEILSLISLPRFRNYRMKSIVWMIREIFKMLNQYAVDNPTLPTSVFPTFSKSWWNVKPFSGNAEPQRRAAKYLGHAWYIGKRFCKSTGVFFSTLSAGVNSVDI